MDYISLHKQKIVKTIEEEVYKIYKNHNKDIEKFHEDVARYKMQLEIYFLEKDLSKGQSDFFMQVLSNKRASIILHKFQ